MTTDFTEAKEHHGRWFISTAVDDEYDKTGQPDPLILTYYFTLGLVAGRLLADGTRSSV